MMHPSRRRRVISARITAASLGHCAAPGGRLRRFEADGTVWWIVSDLCRAYGLRIRPNGRINVTWAVKGLPDDSVALALVEIEPDSLKPYSKILCIRDDRVATLLARHGPHPERVERTLP